jgi:hypothetical protein
VVTSQLPLLCILVPLTGIVICHCPPGFACVAPYPADQSPDCFQLRHISPMPLLSVPSTTALVQALVSSFQECCKSLLIGPPASCLVLLKSILHTVRPELVFFKHGPKALLGSLPCPGLGPVGLSCLVLTLSLCSFG